MTADRRALEDELLVVRCRRGDEAAWRSLVDRYQPRLRCLVRRMVPDGAVDSTLQETWMAIFRGLSRLRAGDRFAPWAYAIARNRSLTRLRWAYADAAARLDDAPPPTTADEDYGRLDDADAVHAGLARLSVAHREVLTLFFLDDLTLAETAAVLGVAEGTVKSRLHRARAALAEHLPPEDA